MDDTRVHTKPSTMSGDNFSVSFFDDVEGDAKKELLEVEERLNRRKFRGASTGKCAHVSSERDSFKY